jgi:hypothetical protein
MKAESDESAAFRRLDVVVRSILQAHWPNPPASERQLRESEERLGFPLDPQMRAFYARCNGAQLYSMPAWRYRILRIEEIQRVRKLILGQDDDRAGPSNWYAICDVQDGDYVCAQVDFPTGRVNGVIDCFHEVFPDTNYCTIIADDFLEFLERAIAGGDRLYWLARMR